MSGRLLIVALVGLLLLPAACRRSVATGPGDVRAPRVSMPSQILGLRVEQEDVSTLIEEVDRSYFDSVGMFSLREDDLLRATFQLARFNFAARPNDARFRSSIIGLLGSSTPQQILVEDTIVYATSGSEQIVYVWFRDRAMFVLSVHRDFEFPRTLLRRALRVEL